MAFQIAVRKLEIAPSEFWNMAPDHFWWLVETLDQGAEAKRTVRDVEPLKELLRQAKAKEKKNG